MPTLRLLSYNVRSLRDDRDALIRVIRSADADVVCIQESPRFARWRSRCAELARRSALVVVCGGRTAGSNLIMSTLGVDVVSTAEVLFSADAHLHRRGTAIALLRLRGSSFAVAGTHLDLVAAARLRHVGELHRALDGRVPVDVPAIVAGDINDVPGSAAWLALEARGADACAIAGEGSPLTSTAKDPHRRIDGVFVDRRITVRSARVLDQPDVAVASDHRPVLVELGLP